MVSKYTLGGRLRLDSVPGLGFLVFYIALALTMAVITMEFGPVVPPFAEGATLRNGYGRVLTTVIKAAILYFFIFTLISERSRVDPLFLFRAYVWSCAILAGLGLLQYIVFSATGVDIFPIGLFDNAERYRSGIVYLGGEAELRINSFAGEPKGFGQAIAVAFALLFVFGRFFGMGRFLRMTVSALFITVIVLAASTSAYFVLIATAGFGWFFTRSGVPLGRLSIQMICLAIALGGAAYYYYAGYVDPLLPPVYETFENHWAFIKERFSRVNLDDFDVLIMKSFIADLPGLLFGRGVGLVHHYAYVFIPSHWEYYMLGNIIPPKSGITFYVGEAGLLGLLLITCFVAALLPSREVLSFRSAKADIALVCGAQAIGFGLLAALMLRLYTVEICWIAFAALHVLGYRYAQVKRGDSFSVALRPMARCFNSKPAPTVHR